MQRAYPGRLPLLPSDDALFSKRLVLRAQLQTLHGGVSLTIAKIREKHWIPPLRRLTKRVINECPGCKRFQVTALANPPTETYPRKEQKDQCPSSQSESTLLGLSSTSARIKARWSHAFYFMHTAQPVPSIWIYYQFKQRNTCCAVWNVSWRDEGGQRKSSPIMGEPTFPHPNN